MLEQLGSNRYPLRDRALFLLGLKTGFRISELLSLTVGAVYRSGRLTEEVSVDRRFMKKKREGRKVPFHNEPARTALELWIGELSKSGLCDPKAFLFRSREGDNRPLNRRTAWEILKRAFAACGMNGKLATHSMRKTFAKQMLEALGHDLLALKEVLGHNEIETTMAYVQFDDKKIREAFRKI